jgi:hypothetical protein
MDPYLETPLELLKLKDYIFYNTLLTWKSLRACSENMADRESWTFMYPFSVGKKKKFESTGFTCSKFPETSEEVHAICSGSTIVICGDCDARDDFYFPGEDDEVTIVPKVMASSKGESSTHSSKVSTALVKVGSKRP